MHKTPDIEGFWKLGMLITANSYHPSQGKLFHSPDDHVPCVTSEGQACIYMTAAMHHWDCGRSTNHTSYGPSCDMELSSCRPRLPRWQYCPNEVTEECVGCNSNKFSISVIHFPSFIQDGHTLPSRSFASFL